MITIIKPGLSDSIQDLGRFGYQKYGVVTSGAMDSFSHRVANLLVGNEETESTLEMTLVGPRISFEEDAVIALCGGDLNPTIDGVALPLWKSIFIKKNSELKLGAARKGCRAYLAISGGFDIIPVMKSRSTYLKAEIGGFKGRTLQAGDTIRVNERVGLSELLYRSLEKSSEHHLNEQIRWKVSVNFLPKLTTDYEIRIMRGRQYDLFNEKSQKRLVNEKYTVSSQSDRMGYRLTGHSLALKKEAELISEAVSFGSIQVPPDGNPIILAADRQTTGGYPKNGQIIAVDLSLIAQAKPGESFTFKEVSLEDAQNLYIERERSLKMLKSGITLKFS